eukprot:PhF_6_TR13857/c0_g1_i1/m.22220
MDHRSRTQSIVSQYEIWARQYSLFSELQERYNMLLNILESRGGYVVCIPPNNTLPETGISYALLKGHILQPYPVHGPCSYTNLLGTDTVVSFNPWECQCTNNNCEACVFRGSGQSGVGTLSFSPTAFPTIKVMRIVQQKNTQFFFLEKALPLEICGGAVVGTTCRSTNNPNGRTTNAPTSHRQTMNEAELKELFNGRCVGKEEALHALDTELYMFHNSGFIPRGFESHVVAKLKRICAEFSANLSNPTDTEEETESIEIAVNTYVLTQTYDVTMPHWRTVFEPQDVALVTAATALRHNVTYASLEVPLHHRTHDTTKAMEHLRTLDGIKHRSVYDILRCMEQVLSDLQPPRTPDEPMMTADDCLPLLIHLIVRTAPRHLASAIQFATEFAYPSMSFSPLGYVLTTFEAASLFVLEEAKKMSRTLNIMRMPSTVRGPTDVVRRVHADAYTSEEQLSRLLTS